MFLSWPPPFPKIDREHLLDARIHSNRNDLISALPVPEHGKVAEIGVWRGEFSKTLMTELKPHSFFAFDIFTGHMVTEWNGMTGRQLFDGLTHREYYEREMAPFLDCVNIVEGPGEVTLRDYTDGSFDFVYVDAAHDYDSVKAVTELAVKMVAPCGFLLFDDYVLFDPNNAAPYGVVPIVNDLAVNHGWRIVGYALHHQLFCNVALVRSSEAHVLAAERDRLLTERDRLAQERDRYALEKEHLREEADCLRQELTDIHRSRSWRATRPLRWLGKALRPN